MAERSCLVVVCHNGPVVYTETAQSLMEIGWGERLPQAKKATGFDRVDHVWSKSWPRVDALRDHAVLLAQARSYDFLLFLDADMAWPSHTIQMLLRHADLGAVVGGLYVLKAPPYTPVAMTQPERPEASRVTQYTPVGEYGTALVPVDLLGMGCTLIPMPVFGRVGARPWFVYGEDDDGWPRVTEDVAFCQRVRAAGIPLYLDPTIKCLHLATTPFDERHWFRYRASMQWASERTTVTMQTEETPA